MLALFRSKKFCRALLTVWVVGGSVFALSEVWQLARPDLNGIGTLTETPRLALWAAMFIGAAGLALLSFFRAELLMLLAIWMFASGAINYVLDIATQRPGLMSLIATLSLSATTFFLWNWHRTSSRQSEASVPDYNSAEGF